MCHKTRKKGLNWATYTYDGNGQRTRALVTQAGATTTTDYTYDGITLLSLDATQGTATWKVTYLYGEDGRPYAGVYTAGTAAPVTFLVATTDRGDVVALTDTAGTWFARYTYDPYGRVLSQTAQAVSGITAMLAGQIATRQPLRYAGYVYDAHSATYYLSARHYDPATMRFLTKDPARDDGEESAYQYCAGDPVGRVDPTGEAAVAVVGGILIVAGGVKFFFDVRSLSKKYRNMIAGYAIYGEWGAWTKKNERRTYGRLDQAAKIKYKKGWDKLTNSQRYTAHNDMGANWHWSKTASSLRKYVLTKKLGVKQSIYWNLVSYVSLGRPR